MMGKSERERGCCRDMVNPQHLANCFGKQLEDEGAVFGSSLNNRE